MASFTAEAHQTAWGKAVPQTDAMCWDPWVTTDSHAGSYGPEPNKAHCFSMDEVAVGNWERKTVDPRNKEDEDGLCALP